MTGPFTVRKHHDGDGAVRIMVSGAIDHDVSEALSHILSNAAGQPGVGQLTVDLGGVSVLSAAGIRSLLAGREMALRTGCAFRVTNAYGLIGDVLRVAGVAGFLSLTAAPPGHDLSGTAHDDLDLWENRERVRGGHA